MENFHVYTFSDTPSNVANVISNEINKLPNCESEVISDSTSYKGLNLKINDKTFSNSSFLYSSGSGNNPYILIICNDYGNECIMLYDSNVSNPLSGKFALIALNNDNELVSMTPSKQSTFNASNIFNLPSAQILSGIVGNKITITKCYSTVISSTCKNVYLNPNLCTFTPGTILETVSGDRFVSIGLFFFILQK